MRYFFGPDTYAVRVEIGRIAKEAGATIRWVEREEIESRSIRNVIDQSGSTLLGKDIPVVRDPSAMPKRIQEEIAAAIEHAATLILWDRGKVDKRSVLYKAVKKEAKEFSAPSRQELVAWLVADSNQSIDPAAAGELIHRIGVDRWRLLSEVERLSLQHGRVTKEIVEQEVPAEGVPEEIFVMLDALAAGKQARAITLMEELLQAGESEFYIISMLAYQFRTLLAVKSGQTAGIHPYVVQKSATAAARYTAVALLEALTKISATDFAIKQGKTDQRTALVMLVSTGLAATKSSRT